MEFSKYIVPIYAGSTLIGSGVLHNSLLVTAAHVVDFCIRGRNFAFQYNSKVYILGWKDKLFFEYDEIKRGTYRDIAIFKTKIDIKGLSFESEELYDGDTASLYGYYDNNDGNLLINQSRGIVRLKPFWDEKMKINIAINKNSFLLMDISKVYECNSGCPLLFNDRIIGILSGGNQDYNYCRFISSSHIIDILSNFKL